MDINHTYVICAYEKSEYLEKCIKSLKRQTIKSKIIVATHTPNDYIRELCKNYNLELFVNEGEGGITQDWNYAISVCGTKYVTIAHQDDVYSPNYTSMVISSLNKKKKPLIAFSDYFEIRNGKKLSTSTMIRIKKILLFPLRFGFVRNNILLRRRCLSLGDPIICPSITYAVENLNIPIFNNNYICVEDWEMLEKVFSMKGDIVYVPHKLCGHRIHSGSTTSKALANGIRKKENLEIFMKFWPLPIAIFINRLYNISEKYNNVEKV